MTQVLFEEDGAFRVGTILSEAGAACQVEAAHGKRSKVKASAVLLRFDGQSLSAFIPEAQSRAEGIDPQFLWEVCGKEEFGFADLARDYYGHAPAPLEATAVALALHACPMYFYRRGKGRYQAAPEENLRAALAGLEKKRRQQEQVDAWAAAIGAGTIPPEIAARLDLLLFKPDKMSLEWRALDQAATQAGLAPHKLLASLGALSGPEDYFLRRFAFELFPQGLAFPEVAPVHAPRDLPQAAAPAFSIDDHETTEIDDAFSVERIAGGRLRVGVHIAAPALFFGRDHALETIARERLSTVYFPGGKITMLPEAAIAEATLAEGREVAAVSLYLDVDADTLAITATETRLERVAIAANLRIAELEQRLHEESLAAGDVEGPHGADLLLLWRLAKKLRAARGAGEDVADAGSRQAENREARLHLPRGGRPHRHRAEEARHADRRPGLRVHDPLERHLGADARRCGLSRHLPQPARHQDAHGSRAGRARLAGGDALRLVELAAAALLRPRQPAPARGAARAANPRRTRATTWRARPASSRTPTRPTPSTSAISSATGACAGSSRRASRRRTRRSFATSWCAWTESRSSVAPSGCLRRPPATACASPSASPTCGR